MQEEEPSIGRAVRTVVRLSRMFERADTGLSLAQFRILELVSRGTERSTHIATRLATSKPAVTAVVDGMVGAGLLTRGAQAGDRRVVRLALTDKGRDALAHAERTFADRLAPLLEATDDPDALLQGLAQIDDAMDARWSEAPRPRRHEAPGPRRHEAPRSQRHKESEPTPEVSR